MIPTYVFVHGSATTSGSWSRMQQEMTQRGHRTLAIDLPGRGAGFSLAYHLQDLETFAAEPSAMTGMTAAANIEHVVDVLYRVRAHGPVVLVGHSFGGLIITAVGNRIPELVDRIVYIAAQCPVDRAAADYLVMPAWSTSELLPAAAALAVGDPAELGFIRLNWRGAGRAAVTALKNAISGESTDDQFVRLLNSTQPDEVCWQHDPEWDHRAEKDSWGRLPRTYIRLTEDRSMPLAAQDRYISEADALTPANQFEVHSVASSHSGFLHQPGEVADILAKLS